jgi:nitrate reductase assembly molybdenum cofactor insertion protein NarJ
MSYAHYGTIGELMDFPGPGFAAHGQTLLEFLRRDHPDAAEEVAQFLDGIPPRTPDLQELYTRTFDVQAVTTLSTGYVLFGDDYKRGALLSNLNREHNEAHNDCRGELADYLPNVLRLIPHLRDQELQRELVEQILVPALMLMIKEFDPERIEKKNASYRKHYKTLIDSVGGCDSGIYRLALEAVLKVLVRDFPVSETMKKLSEWSNRPQTVDFLQLVEKEMDIEQDANPVNSGCDA